MTLVALCGWALSIALAAMVVVGRRRLELVAQAEHELRRPIAALALGLESPAGPRPEALEAQLDRIRLGLADLEAARAGRRAPADHALVPLEGVVNRAAAGWRPAASRTGRRLELDWRAGPVAVRADRRRISQALGNLLSNAFEHGGGPVELRGSRSPGGVRIEIRDRGPGFGRAATPERASGHGRGLRIATKAVEEAGGRLSVSSHERGASVAVELPVAEE